MTPHRRRCLIKAILEIKGALSIAHASGTVVLISPEKLVLMTNAELLTLYVELEKAFESANITEPAPGIEDMETIVMEPVRPKKG